MKRKAMLILTTVMLTSLTGCSGAQAQATNANNVTEVSTIIESADVPIESTAMEETNSSMEVEEPVYTELEDLFLADNYKQAGKESLEAVDEDSIESTFEKYALSDSVDVYNFEGTWVGYSKPNIEVLLFGTNDKWAEVSFLSTILYVPKDIFNSVATPKAGTILYRDEEPETESSEVLLAEVEEPAPKQETAPTQPKTEIPAPVASDPAVATEPVVTEEPAITQSVTEPEPVVDNDKYTPEEAIAVYRGIMEANGIQWDSSIKEFASWGTGWFYLDKGWIDKNAYQNVEVFRMGGGDATHPWIKYCIEITGSDENAVYFTQWHCS